MWVRFAGKSRKVSGVRIRAFRKGLGTIEDSTPIANKRMNFDAGAGSKTAHTAKTLFAAMLFHSIMPISR